MAREYDKQETQEEKKTSGSLKNVKRKRKASDLLLQLAVVIAGILITFQGSSWVERHARKQQMKEVLTSVRNELELNKLILDGTYKRIEHELEMADFFTRHLYDLDSAPGDTIFMYAGFTESRTKFQIVTDALQVLKASTASVDVMDKLLLQEIFSCYDNMEKPLMNFNHYFDKKMAVADEFWASSDSRLLTNMLSIYSTGSPYSEDVLAFVKGYFSINTARNLLVRTRSFLKVSADEMIGEMMPAVQSTIEIIDAYIAGKDISGMFYSYDEEWQSYMNAIKSNSDDRKKGKAGRTEE